MRAAEICKLLDRANDIRRALGARPGTPIHRIPHPPGIKRPAWWSRIKQIARLENRAAQLLNAGLSRRKQKRL